MHARGAAAASRNSAVVLPANIGPTYTTSFPRASTDISVCKTKPPPGMKTRAQCRRAAEEIKNAEPAEPADADAPYNHVSSPDMTAAIFGVAVVSATFLILAGILFREVWA